MNFAISSVCVWTNSKHGKHKWFSAKQLNWIYYVSRSAVTWSEFFVIFFLSYLHKIANVNLIFFLQWLFGILLKNETKHEWRFRLVERKKGKFLLSASSCVQNNEHFSVHRLKTFFGCIHREKTLHINKHENNPRKGKPLNKFLRNMYITLMWAL